MRDTRRPLTLIVSCEHGGSHVPARYASAFAGAGKVLATHRGYDAGAADVALRLAALSPVPAQIAYTTRLLVDLNRSLHHRMLFSRYTCNLGDEEKSHILREHYLPYREAVTAHVDAAIAAGSQVLHLSSHSFTPVLNGERRNADFGLLYDPARRREQRFAAAWRNELLAAMPSLKVRRNYPYRGVADGFVTALRDRFDKRDYIGLELEVNQRLVTGDDWSSRVDGIVGTVQRLIG